ncbi:MAG TPA: hypothetical protein VGV35_03450 [Bryobacteraceae bacterium]|nr:hypothetical protein [Bryobacteraceae bacterium]
MNHISEEQLVLFYYGEQAESAGIESHLEECEACRSEFRALQLLLNTVNAAPVPERGPEYGPTVWKRIEKRVGRSPRRIFQWWIWAPAMAALVLVSFMAGRLSHRAVGPDITIATNSSGSNGSGSPANPSNAATNSANSKFRERILLVAVGDHLERSQMVLAELTNAPNGQGKLDISDERQTAADLLEDNRLYRQTARSTGDTAVASVLDDLERVLIEIAHSPTEVSSGELDDLRQQIENRGLLFKVRVLGSRVRELESKPAPEKDKDAKKL